MLDVQGLQTKRLAELVEGVIGESEALRADIARRLRLRPPTISHHLKSLRIAGLIAYIGEGSGETRYGVRLAQIADTCDQLKRFLKA